MSTPASTITLEAARKTGNVSILPIISRHAKLSEAVKAAGIDLSYNEPLALRDLARHDKDSRHGEAYVVTLEGKTDVVYLYTAPDGLQIFHRYSPFHGCLDNTPFNTAFITGDGLAWVIVRSNLNRSTEARKTIAKLGWIVTTNF